MSSLVTTETHERLHSRAIDRKELRNLVMEFVCRELGIKRQSSNVTVSVRFQDVVEGSPSYKVGIEAVVTVIEDLSAAADVDPAPPGGQISGG